MSNNAYRIVVDIAPRDYTEEVTDYLGPKDVKEVVESVLTTVRASLPPKVSRFLVVGHCAPTNEHFHVHRFDDCDYACDGLANGDVHPGER